MGDAPLLSGFVDAAKVDAHNLEGKGSRASLDRSPKENWVERAGGLPPYVREVARAIEREQGMPLERAIPIAIGRIKKWARGGGDVTAATRAKAAAALAEWEALKAKSGAKFDSDLLAELERKAMPAFIKDKIAARDDDDDEGDPKRKPHKYVAPAGGGGLCKKCMAPKGAKVHVDTADDEKAIALIESYKALGEVLARAGALPGGDELGDATFDNDALDAKGLTLEELQRADNLRGVVAADDMTDLLARGAALRAAVETKAASKKPEGFATVAERVAAARGFDEGAASAKGEEPKGPKKGRKVRTDAGASRYGVPIGEFYTKEKGEGPVERGESGERTRAAQKALVAAGLLDAKDGTNGDAEDGFFGPKTEAAIKKWQDENDLEVTGVLDEETERMLVKARLKPDSGDGGDESDPKPVTLGDVSDAEWDRLLAAGWRGKPGDRAERLYPPTAPKKAAAAKGDASTEAIRAQLAAMPAAERERLVERARQVVAALAAL